MVEIAMLVIMATLLVAIIVLYRRGRGEPKYPATPERGSLHVTGVSPRPDAEGEQFVTITGNLAGPSVPDRVVYGRFVWDVNSWPHIGEEIPVVYPAGKPDRWQIAR
ncbi:MULTISPECIES: hypothetical protein [Nocardia]|uniref:hypothetical protein n=1 Tax=Nocardia TaxID=1817 RepID=UPI000D68E5D7|nr:MULTISPECIES: hypothetical protein [Nocardia]